MSPNSFVFLLLSFLCILFQAFFSMMEMASVSFNRIRLYSYVKNKYSKAMQLKYLLDKPSRLFTTTLVLVNVFLLTGSEASRRFYESIHLNPDWAIVTQTLFVLIFGELIPLIIARNYPQHVAFFGVSIVNFFAKILGPVIQGIDFVFKKLSHFWPHESSFSCVLSREEIPSVFEEKVGDVSENEEMTHFVTTLFDLRSKQAKSLMKIIDSTILISSETLISEAEKIFSTTEVKFLLIYQGSIQNIQFVLYPLDILSATKEEKAEKYGKTPWFIFGEMPLLKILKKFPETKHRIAVVLGQQGLPIGYLSQDRIVKTLFFTEGSKNFNPLQTMVQKNILASMTLEEFNDEFKAHLFHPKAKTIEEFLQAHFHEKPYVGEVLTIDQFEFTILEASVREIKKVSVKTISFQ